MNGNEMREEAKRFAKKSEHKDLNECPFEEVSKLLMPNEEVKLSFGAKIGEFHKRIIYIAVVITNKRLLMVSRPDTLIRRAWETHTFKLSDISSVSNSDLGVQIYTVGNERIWLRIWSSEARQAIVDAIIEVLNLFKDANIPNNGALSSADEIRKYKQLFDEGIITEEEFIIKKKQLLGL